VFVVLEMHGVDMLSNIIVINVRVQKINKLLYKSVCMPTLYAGEYRTSVMRRNLFGKRDYD
jgi:hypothetical protein